MKMPELLPPPDTMYRALLNRDSSFEGIFYAGVRTTGIFLPAKLCSAKKNRKRVNVDFFATPSEALHSGLSSVSALSSDGSGSGGRPKLIARFARGSGSGARLVA